MGFRTKSDAMVYVRIAVEEFFEDMLVFLTRHLYGHTQGDNIDLRKLVVHAMSET